MDQNHDSPRNEAGSPLVLATRLVFATDNQPKSGVMQDSFQNRKLGDLLFRSVQSSDRMRATSFSVVLSFHPRDAARLHTIVASLRRHLRVEDMDAFVMISPCSDARPDAALCSPTKHNSTRLRPRLWEGCYELVQDFVPRDKFVHWCDGAVGCAGDDRNLAVLGATRRLHSPHTVILDTTMYAVAPVSSHSLLVDGRSRALCMSPLRDEFKDALGAFGAPNATSVECWVDSHVVSTSTVHHMLDAIEHAQREPWFEAIKHTKVTPQALYSTFFAVSDLNVRSVHDVTAKDDMFFVCPPGVPGSECSVLADHYEVETRGEPPLTWLLVLYLCPAIISCLYASHRLWNIVRLVIAPPQQQPGVIPAGDEPRVTVQICAYNEAEVIEATIDAACQVDWPRHKLRVEVLDDSTDHTSSIIETCCAKWRAAGVDARRKPRPNRRGFKAGALAHNHSKVATEFVAYYDADHRADPTVLRRSMPYFFDDQGKDAFDVGLVQCPWGYYNRRNLLTECDALNLDSAFVIEQEARTRSLEFLSFNGTGGVWRKAAVDAGGGWAWDTVTEDLDLSYRAYRAGYRMRFVKDLVQYLELPASLRAFKSQKHRWTKGYAQVTVKSLTAILVSPVSWRMKIEACFHLTSNVQYACGLACGVLVPVLSWYRMFTGWVLVVSLYPAVAWLIVGVFTVAKTKSGVGRLPYIFACMALSVGMSVQESLAILEGWVSTDATFIRTPKEGGSSTTLGAPHTPSSEDTTQSEGSEPVTCLDGACTIAVPSQETVKKIAFIGEITMLVYSTSWALLAIPLTHGTYEPWWLEYIHAALATVAVVGYCSILGGVL